MRAIDKARYSGSALKRAVDAIVGDALPRNVWRVGQNAQPMDDEKNQGRVVEVKPDPDNQTYRVKLSSGSTWYDQDELETP